ncbi:MAG: hypothetical protein ONA90_11215 [candidate division KSB1 bacterium]|nr:hypothetical protein [candidate division KSB1 bacterium]
MNHARPFANGLAASLRLMIAALALTLLFSGMALAQEKQDQVSVSGKSSGFDSVSVHALWAEPGKASLYDLTFVTTDTLAANAEIVIVFPRGFDLTPLEIAGSSDINGGFKLERKDQEVRLHRTGLGEKVPPGRKVSVKLGLIVNPSDLAASHEVSVQLRSFGQAAIAATKNQHIQFITPAK